MPTGLPSGGSRAAHAPFPGLSLLVAALLALAVLVLPTAAQAGPPPPNVQAPSPWYAGDTHEMIQLCQGPGGVWPPDRDPNDVYREMLQKDLRISNVLVLVTGNHTCQEYLTQYAPRVTGQESPITAADPDFFLQFGCEAVGGPDPGCPYPAWGHVAGLGVSDAVYPLAADYPAPILDFFRAQPGAVAGYPHVAWPVGTVVPDDFPPINIDETRIYPLMAPFDIALGRVDFLSTPDVGHVATSITSDPWWGLWYKLLSAGERIPITGGTVAQCYLEIANLDARTWVRLDSEPLNFPKWIQAMKEGRVSISDGTTDFLRLRVNNVETGEEVHATAGSLALVEATLTTSVARTTQIEIVQDGKVVASEPVQMKKPGTHTFRILTTLQRSGWFAARTAKTHTGAVYAIVDGKPIADPDAAEYFRSFGDALLAYMDLAKQICAACGQPTCPACTEVQRWFGTSEPEIRKNIADGQRVWQAVRDYSLAPRNAERYGVSTPACRGPIGIGVRDDGAGGGKLTFTCFDAPPGAGGVLVLGAARLAPSLSYRGAGLLIATSPAPTVLPVRSNAGGYAELEVQLPVLPRPADLYAQFLWQDTPACPGVGPLSASDAVRVGLPR